MESLIKEMREGTLKKITIINDQSIFPLSYMVAPGVWVIGMPYPFLAQFHTQSKNDKEGLAEQPFFSALGHELMHVLHGKNDPHLPPTLGENFDSLEEQLTITGLDRPFPKEVAELRKIDIEDSNLNEVDLEAAFHEKGLPSQFRYQEINENRLLTSFGLSYRINHLGEGKLNLEACEKRQKALDEIFEILEKGEPDELQKFLKANNLSRNYIFQMILMWHVTHGRIDSLSTKAIQELMKIKNESGTGFLINFILVSPELNTVDLLIKLINKGISLDVIKAASPDIANDQNLLRQIEQNLHLP